MKRYLLNSAVITAPGTYEYQHISLAAAKTFLARKDWESCIGYPETAEAIEKLSDIPIPVSRKVITMQAGDEALVFRLVFPAGYRPSPAQKGGMGQDFIMQHSEIGLLRKIL